MNDEIRKQIASEILEVDIDVRASFLKRYSSEIEEFINNMSRAFISWCFLQSKTKDDERKEHISCLVFNSINLHVVSMKLFLLKYIVAAGNIERQSIETIALAILCSNKQTDIFERYIRNQYSANNAVRDVKRHSKNMNLSKKGLDAMGRAHKCFHAHSHPSYVTIGSSISFDGDGKGIYLGASFDKGKVKFYDKEVAGRLNLSAFFENYIIALESAISKW